MNNLVQSQIFFFISSVGFIIITCLFVVVLLYILRAVNLFTKILKKIEGDLDSIGDTTKEMFEDIKDSSVFRFLFKNKNKNKK